MPTKPIRFIHRGQVVTRLDVPPERTLLELLREDLHCTGTKEGCGEGDCGACTVVLGEPAGDGLRWRAINSCIRLAHSIDGMALWTVQELRAADGSLHPVQQAMVDCHASQCGFCTPGFVMSLFAQYQSRVATSLATTAQTGAPRALSRDEAQEALSGNLCRCTGYRPILDAAQRMHQYPVVAVDEVELRQQLQALQTPDETASLGGQAYLQPHRLAELLRLRALHPQAQLVAGCTDVGLWVTKLHRQFEQVLDITQVQELRRIERYRHHVAIGAAVTLQDAFGELLSERPQLHAFASRFAGLPVRNSGTLGGNVANGSPIGDSMPLLIALGAHVVLMSQRGHRELPLEQLYTGYRQNLMAADEVLAWIKVPRPTKHEWLRAYKLSKRYDDDISAVCLALRLELKAGRVAQVSIGVGGVAATPQRAWQTQAALQGQPWSEARVQAARAVLHQEFSPLSDMRASADYRRDALANLLQRAWLESQGHDAIALERVRELA